jgi:hypothetical protein
LCVYVKYYNVKYYNVKYYNVKYYNVSTVKHNSCIFHYYVKMFLQKQHVSTQLRAGIVMKLKMSIHKQLAYLWDTVQFTYNIKYTYKC